MMQDQKRKYPEDVIQTLDSDFADFDRMYYRYAARLVVYARRFVDGKYAEDVVQDVFLRCWQLGHFRLPEARLQPLLYRSVLNACRNLIRHNLVADRFARNSLEKLHLGEVEYELRILDEQHDERTDRLHELIEALPDRCREVFLLSWFENLKSDEIADRLHISRRTVDTQLYKALQFLRHRMMSLVGGIGALFCIFF